MSMIVPRDLDSEMERIYSEQKKAKAAKTDFEYEKEIRETKKVEAKLIEAKEIEESAWFHAVRSDLGNYAYHNIIKNVTLGEEELRDADKAVGKLTAYLDDLMKLRDDATAFWKLKEEYEVANRLLDELTAASGELANKHIEMKRQLLNTVSMIQQCPKCTQRMMNVMIASGALSLIPEATEK